MKKNIFYVFVLAVIALMLTESEAVIRNTRQSLIMCYEIIIPSLFPFFVCSGLLIYSGFAEVVARYAEPVMRPMFNVAPSGAAAFVLGIVSGFPLGAVCAKDLYKSGNLSKVEAERLLAFCNNSGPLFIIGTIGTALYSKPVYGVMLYVIHIIASILVGVIFRAYGKNQHQSPKTRINTNEIPITSAISLSLDNAAKNIIAVCFSIVFFSSISQTLLELLPLSGTAYAVLSGLFEFSTGVLRIARLSGDTFVKLVLTSLVVGFSGLAVHLQVMSVTADAGLSLKPYILGKLLHGAIAATLTALAIAASRVDFAIAKPTAPLSLSCFISVLCLALATTLVAILARKHKNPSSHETP